MEAKLISQINQLNSTEKLMASTNYRYKNDYHQEQQVASVQNTILGLKPQLVNIQSGSTQNAGKSEEISYLITRYLDLNIVRKMIAQYLVEFILICVIIIYLLYYFSQISRRPKLIGDPRSKFVDFIKRNLNDTLSRRFSPLIYWWGTNPQTALFGYLLGNTSTDEMPRSCFWRQYLYISDAQYLTSNVDLSKYYISKQKATKRKLYPLLELQVSQQMEQQVAANNQLNQNIRLALCDMMMNHGDERQTGLMIKDPASSKKAGDEHDLSGSSGFSSDSGVFPGHSSSSSNSSSTGSLSDMATAIDMPHLSCSCRDHIEIEPALVAHSVCSSSSGESAIQGEQSEFGQCALDWHKASHRHYHTNKLVALIAAGMTTGSDKKYVTDTVTTLEQLGYEVVVFIRRGCGGLKLSSTKFFSPAKWRDFEAAVQSVKHQRPESQLVAVGFSFGSLELCRYLSMSGKNSLINAALLLSCPFDPEAGGRNMRKRLLNRRIDAYLAQNLAKQLYQAISSAPASNGPMSVCNQNGSIIDLSRLPKIKSLAEFEDNYNRVLQNYPNSEAYAADCRLQELLQFIETPTLCVSSEDDFMAPLKLLPLDQIQANKNLCMVLTKRGGHMAFVDGLVWPEKPYFAQRIVGSYMGAVKSSLLAQNTNTNTKSGKTESLFARANPSSKINDNNNHFQPNKQHQFIQMFSDGRIENKQPRPLH